ncbi:MAG: dihydropteroate synthase [Thermodesulfobacteriota bacterium]
MIIIAERINASRKSIAAAISAGDAAFIQNEARIQDLAGADYIDVNAGTFVGEEIEKLKWVIAAVQEVTEKPLCLDSPDPKVIRAAALLVKNTPMINSITLEPERFEGILPIAADRKAKLIALCQSEDAMAESADDKVRLAEKLVEKVSAAGIPPDDLFIDPLVYPLSTNTRSAVATLRAIERIMTAFPGIHTTCGLTNVSYGLPARKLVNRTFLTAAILHGLDSAIMDPTDRQLYGALKAALAVSGRDDFCMGLIGAFREGKLE